MKISLASLGLFVAGCLATAARAVVAADVGQDETKAAVPENEKEARPKNLRGADDDRKLKNLFEDDGGEPSPDTAPTRELSGRVIVSRKTEKKLQKEGKTPNEIAAIRSQGMSEIKKNKVVFESGGEGDFQVVEIGKGKEAAYIRRLLKGTKGYAFEFAEPDYIEYPIATPNDGSQLANQYHHNNMQSYAAWDIATGADNNVTVAICDTGIQLDHPDLKDNRLEGYQATTQLWESQGGDVSFVHPHGTNCAGCAAAIGNNGVGLSGVGWSFKHRPGRVSDQSSGSASSSVLAHCAREMCALSDVKAVGVSYSGVEGQARRDAATYCKSQGALMVNAAGNDSRDLSSFGDADADDLIVVGASTSSDTKSGFSAYGRFVDVWAPGSSVWTTTTGGGYAPVSGTSFSCPLTVGLIALIWSVDPSLTPNEVETILKTSTDNVGIQVPSLGNTPYGRVNSFRAVQAAVSGTLFPTQSPTTYPPTPSPTPCPPTGCSWTTTFIDNNGSAGNTFQIQAKKDIEIAGFDVHNSGTGSITVQVWHRAGTYSGFENGSAGWTQILTTTVTAAGDGIATEVPNFGSRVSIAEGATHSFHVHTGSGHQYTNGVAEGRMYGDNEDLEFYEGRGCGGVFSCSFTPRVFNGVIKYFNTPAGTPPPTDSPTSSPTKLPTTQPTNQPTNAPIDPTFPPTLAPTQKPTAQPTNAPSTSPSKEPTSDPTLSPTAAPTQTPTTQPANAPIDPTPLPSAAPTQKPTAPPTNAPSTSPSKTPTSSPLKSPSKAPSRSPTKQPTNAPIDPTLPPSAAPSTPPTVSPTGSPSKEPTAAPTNDPIPAPTSNPTPAPTPSPTSNPTTPPPIFDCSSITGVKNSKSCTNGCIYYSNKGAKCCVNPGDTLTCA